MCLLIRVWAAVYATVLRRRKFLKSSSKDRVGFLVLATVGHHFVCICTDKVALKTMKVRRFILYRTYRQLLFELIKENMQSILCNQMKNTKTGGVETTGAPACYISAILLEITSHQRVQPFVSGSML